MIAYGHDTATAFKHSQTFFSAAGCEGPGHLLHQYPSSLVVWSSTGTHFLAEVCGLCWCKQVAEARGTEVSCALPGQVTVDEHTSITLIGPDDSPPAPAAQTTPNMELEMQVCDGHGAGSACSAATSVYPKLRTLTVVYMYHALPFHPCSDSGIGLCKCKALPMPIWPSASAIRSQQLVRQGLASHALIQRSHFVLPACLSTTISYK